MGLFDWLRAKPRDAVAESEDIIWLSLEAKFRGLSGAVEDRLRAARLVLVAAHFQETLLALRAELDGRGLAYAVLDDSRLAAAVVRQAGADSAAHLLLALAETLQPDHQAVGGMPNPVLSTAPEVEIIVAERHFLRERDEAIVAFASALDCRARVTFHASLRDPLLRAFAGEWVENVLGRLGAKEDEPILSKLVGRRLRAAQGKFSHRTISDRPAPSAQEWLALNVPDQSE